MCWVVVYDYVNSNFLEVTGIFYSYFRLIREQGGCREEDYGFRFDVGNGIWLQ